MIWRPSELGPNALWLKEIKDPQCLHGLVLYMFQTSVTKSRGSNFVNTYPEFLLVPVTNDDKSFENGEKGETFRLKLEASD